MLLGILRPLSLTLYSLLRLSRSTGILVRVTWQIPDEGALLLITIQRHRREVRLLIFGGAPLVEININFGHRLKYFSKSNEKL